MQVHMLGQRVRDLLLRAGVKRLRDLSASRIQAAVAALGEPRPERPTGLSKQSLQHYVRAVKQFSRWLQREGRTAEHALAGVKGYNADTDKRRERRGFTADEMKALLAATRRAPDRWGMSGPARAAAYALAFASGLRRNEIRTLTRASFHLDGNPPTVTVKAGYSKHRREDVQPLPADVAKMLADFLATADPERPFPLPDKTGRMLAADMADARAAWAADASTAAERQAREEDGDFLRERDTAGLVLDFHSTRHAYVTAICRADVSPRVMMELARHSDPRLTMKRYSRVAVADSARALDFLPKLGAAGPETERAELRRTGTDDAAVRADLTGENRIARQIARRGQNGPQPVIHRQDAGLDNRGGDGPGCVLPVKTCQHLATLDGAQTPVAQLDRASVFGTEGCRFESCRV